MASSIESTYLSWTQRPPSVKNEVDRCFAELAKKGGSSWGAYNGPKQLYGICGTDEPKIIRQSILENPERTDFYVIDVGAGQFGFGKKLTDELMMTRLPRQELTVHIISLRGEQHNGGAAEIYHDGICKIYNIGAFRIDEVTLELEKHGIDLKGRGVDLITSHWCFNHLPDPLGTLVQYYDLLRIGGIFSSTFFHFKIAEEKMGLNLLGALTLMGAPFIVKRRESAINQFDCLIKKVTDFPCQLPLQYEGIEAVSMKDVYSVSERVTSFRSTVPFPRVEPARPARRFACMEISGDRELYLWLRNNNMFNSACSWNPIIPKGGSSTPNSAEAAFAFLQREKIQTASKEEFIALASDFDINDCDKEGNTALHIALQEKRGDIAQWLLENGANPNIKNYDEFHTALDVAIEQGASSEMVALISEAREKMEAGILPTAPRATGRDDAEEGSCLIA